MCALYFYAFFKIVSNEHFVFCSTTYSEAFVYTLLYCLESRKKGTTTWAPATSRTLLNQREKKLHFFCLQDVDISESISVAKNRMCSRREKEFWYVCFSAKAASSNQRSPKSSFIRNPDVSIDDLYFDDTH